MLDKIVLASKSKVRKEILDKHNIVSEVKPSNVDEDIVNEEENACAQEKTKENVRTMSQLRKLSSTNPAGAKESVNLQENAARNSPFTVLAKSIKLPWKSCQLREMSRRRC